MDPRAMPGLRVLVANEPRLYRDVIAATLAELRPQSSILVADPPDLDAAILRHRPDFVVCSGLTDAVQSGAVAWAVLYPAGARHADVGLGRARLTLHPVQLDALLVLLDCAASLAQMSENGYPRMSQENHPEMSQRKLAHP